MTSDDYYRALEAQLNAEFPIETMRLDISMLRFQLETRTKERDAARAERDALKVVADSCAAAVALADAQLEIEAAVEECGEDADTLRNPRWSSAVQAFARAVSAYRKATGR